MLEHEYWKALEPYQAWYGDSFLISNEKILEEHRKHPKTASEDPTGNGILYLCMHMLILEQNGWLTEDHKRDFKVMLKKCMPKELGLLQRSPWKADLQTHDDLKAAMYVCDVLDLFNLKASIYYYCQQRFKGPWYYPFDCKYIYNTETPGLAKTPSGKNAHLGRFLDLRAHFSYCMKKEPSIWERAGWNFTVDQACNKGLKDHTSWLLTYFLTRAMWNDKTQIKTCAAWEQAYVNKFSEEHDLGKDGLFANCLQENHPVGLAFRWQPKYLGQI